MSSIIRAGRELAESFISELEKSHKDMIERGIVSFAPMEDYVNAEQGWFHIDVDFDIDKLWEYNREKGLAYGDHRDSGRR